MKVIKVDNVNTALEIGIDLIKSEGIRMKSRVGDTLEVPEPVATVYTKPWERVLINKLRDANPFFHLMEAMWIIAGRQDVKFLTEFNKRMAEYSDDGEVFNAPYGYRLRNLVDKDQLDEVINILKKDPNSRQAVCQIWDANDLGKSTKDKACNMSMIFRIRNGDLDLTVYNRSNDMIWGAYGANVVQFSMLQEYVAAHLKLLMGKYTQVSNSFHVYTSGPGGAKWDQLKDEYFNSADYYCYKLVPMRNSEMSNFEHDLKQFFNVYDQWGLEEIGHITKWESGYFNNLIIPVLCVYITHKKFGPKEALKHTLTIEADDWRIACEQWLQNRLEARLNA